MKITLDKNFLLVQFILVMVFYIINNSLAERGVIRSRRNLVSRVSSSISKLASRVSGSKPKAFKCMNRHFDCTKPITSDCVMMYVLSNQFGVPGCHMQPKSRVARIVATVQRVIFVAMLFGALTHDKNVCNLMN